MGPSIIPIRLCTYRHIEANTRKHDNMTPIIGINATEIQRSMNVGIQVISTELTMRTMITLVLKEMMPRSTASGAMNPSVSFIFDCTKVALRPVKIALVTATTS